VTRPTRHAAPGDAGTASRTRFGTFRPSRGPVSSPRGRAWRTPPRATRPTAEQLQVRAQRPQRSARAFVVTHMLVDARYTPIHQPRRRGPVRLSAERAHRAVDRAPAPFAISRHAPHRRNRTRWVRRPATRSADGPRARPSWPADNQGSRVRLSVTAETRKRTWFTRHASASHKTFVRFVMPRRAPARPSNALCY